MLLPDANVLVYAHRKDTDHHQPMRTWLESLIGSDQAYGMSDLVLSRFLQIVTHPRIFKRPSPLKDALAFASAVRSEPNCVPVAPGPRHWEIFARLCRLSTAKGHLVPAAYLAALAVESGSEWITTDGDYGRFRGLRWRHPLH